MVSPNPVNLLINLISVLVPEYSIISYLCNGFDFNQWTVLVVNKLSVHLGMKF